MHNHDGWICTFASSKDAFFDAKDQDKRFPIEEGLIKKQMTAFKTMIVYAQFWNQKTE